MGVIPVEDAIMLTYALVVSKHDVDILAEPLKTKYRLQRQILARTHQVFAFVNI